ncbi:unnamed protein product [Urochloa humidicola]
MGMAKAAAECCCCVVIMVVFTGAILSAAKTACDVPFLTSVDEASLARLSLAAPAPAGHNGTPAPAPGPALPPALSYDLALVVALRWYTRWVVGFSREAPLEAKLRFLGRPLARARLAGAESAAAAGGELSEMLYRLAWNETTLLALGPGAAAAFARESAAGVFEMELVVAGVFESSFRHSRWCGVRVRCPLRLSVSTSSVAAPPFASVACSS